MDTDDGDDDSTWEGGESEDDASVPFSAKKTINCTFNSNLFIVPIKADDEEVTPFDMEPGQSYETHPLGPTPIASTTQVLMRRPRKRQALRHRCHHSDPRISSYMINNLIIFPLFKMVSHGISCILWP